MPTKIPPYLQTKSNLMNDRRIKKLSSDMPNGQGLGLFFGLKFILLNEPNQRCYLSDVDNVAYDLRTSTPLLLTVINNYNLFAIEEDEFGKKFFCPLLDESLKPYFEKCKTNRDNALIGVEKKRLKQKLQIQEIKNKLSEDDSSKRTLNNREANISKVNKEISNTTADWDSLNDVLLIKQLNKDKRKELEENLAFQNNEVEI